MAVTWRSLDPIQAGCFWFLASALFLGGQLPGRSRRTAHALSTVGSPNSIASSFNWETARMLLEESAGCVVTIPGLETYLETLQLEFADRGPTDVDLRARIRLESAHEDCLRVCKLVVSPDSDFSATEEEAAASVEACCAQALEELARGVSSLAPQSLGSGVGVFVRIVCASSYRAHEPPYHTDKAPFRGYATLRGVGTEYMNRPCNPLEYLRLRTLGDASKSMESSLHQARELQFIVMKGDYYYFGSGGCTNSLVDGQQKETFFMPERVWQRARACVHRSPPGNGGRRVIISFDLADGDDDREWYQVGTRRAWRNGLTQRKSRLVA